jgi:hypothetical protein
MGKAPPDNGQIEGSEPANRRSAQSSGYAAEDSSTQSACIDLVRTDDNPTGVYTSSCTYADAAALVTRKPSSLRL